MNDTIETLDAEIARLQAEIGSVERRRRRSPSATPRPRPSCATAEALYRTHGLKVGAAHPAETAHLQRQALIGACMVVGADKLLQAERQRIEAQGEGMSAADKARRLDELRRQILQTAAKRELLRRSRRRLPGAEAGSS